MSQIRKAHSVEIIDRLLRDAEASGRREPMELIGLYDELTRVERKWMEKFRGEHQPKNVARKRPLADASAMDARFERSKRLIEATLRRDVGEPVEKAELQRLAERLSSRTPISLAIP